MLDLVATDPGRPRVTWYGPDHERVELSAKTLQNWVSKTANLLADELDAGPGTRLGLALPAHWRTVVWMLAGWSVGAHVIAFPPAAPPIAPASTPASAPASAPALGEERVDVLVTDHPSSPPAGVIESTLVVVALPALATRFLGDVPTGAVDAAAEVRLQPDVFVVGDRPHATDPAFTADGHTLDHGTLLDAARAAVTVPGRILTGAGPERAVESWLGPLAVGGSLVLHHHLADLAPDALAHLRSQETVTSVDA